MAQFITKLPIGAKIKFGRHSVNGETPQDIIWLVVDKSTGNYVTLITQQIIDLRAVDAAEANNSLQERKNWGNNYYPVSNIHRWLNSAEPAGQWYGSGAHSADAAPTSLTTTGKTAYADRPGFLYYFTPDEQNGIWTTTIRCARPDDDGGGSVDIETQVFLPSLGELLGEVENNTEVEEGGIWEYFLTLGHAQATLSQQAATYSLCRDFYANDPCRYWARTPNAGSGYVTSVIRTSGEAGDEATVKMGEFGVRPALSLDTMVKVSDTTDSDGCYTCVWNAPPNTPTISVSTNPIYAGKQFSIQCSGTDPNAGDSLKYEIGEWNESNNTWSVIKSWSSESSVSRVIPDGTKNTVRYRVRTRDSSNADSEYAYTPVITVVNDSAPVISGIATNLGVKNGEFAVTYKVEDANNDEIMVTESISAIGVIRSYLVTLGNTNTLLISGETWLKIPNGTHTITITAKPTDSTKKSATVTATFAKSVDSCSIQNSNPMAASAMPTRIKVNISKNIPPEATMKVEVCNNGYDSSPTWEDATSSVTSALVHLFSNTTKTASKWGVKIRVTINRNGGSGACYITSIGGNFE